MAHFFDRRTFLHVSLLSAGALSLPRTLIAQSPPPGAAEKQRIIARPFELSQVRLRPGAALDAMNVNRRHLLAYDPDRLLHTFRLTAGLPTSAEPLGGWEAPNNELRGHFTGHYLSACARCAAHAGDAAMKARGDVLVAELAKCQAAIGNGYLSAFPEECSIASRTGQPVVGAVLHAAQDHGRHARHARARRQRAGTRACSSAWRHGLHYGCGRSTPR